MMPSTFAFCSPKLVFDVHKFFSTHFAMPCRDCSKALSRSTSICLGIDVMCPSSTDDIQCWEMIESWNESSQVISNTPSFSTSFTTRILQSTPSYKHHQLSSNLGAVSATDLEDVDLPLAGILVHAVRAPAMVPSRLLEDHVTECTACSAYLNHRGDLSKFQSAPHKLTEG